MDPRPSPAPLGRTALLAAAYFATARLGLALGAVGGVATTVWPPTGLSLAALLIFGRELWPGVALGALAANLTVGVPWWGALGIAAGNTLEAVAGAAWLERAGFRRELDRVRDVAALVLLGALASTALSAFLGTTFARLSGAVAPGEFTAALKAWCLGDAAGDLLVAPVLLTWSARRGPARRPREAAALAAVVVAICGLIFARRAPGLVRPYALFPALIWACLRFGPAGASAATLLATALCVAGTTLGRGPYAIDGLGPSLATLQAFMAVTALTSLTLAAAAAERDAAEARTRALNDELERRVRARTAELASANAELEAFGHSIAHDLRGPLRGISGYAHELRRLWPDPPDAARAEFERVGEAVARMNVLIEGLLRLSGLTHATMAPERVDLGELARRVLADLARAEPDRRARWEVAEGLSAAGDPALLGVLMRNLLENAWKFTRGRPEARIEVGRTWQAGVPVFFVSDDGAGFDSARAPELFRPFRRFHDAARFPGTGVGLAMARRVVERHGGRIWAEAAPGRGAAFYFTLPGGGAPPA